MTFWTYEDFASSLPRPSEDAKFKALLNRKEPDISGSNETAFIGPNLTLNSHLAAGAEKSPQVILISAPAAVGKSSMARRLAMQTGNPLWDLSEHSVGSRFFSGTIVEDYDIDGFTPFIAALRAGQVCLILDAADEALLRSGAENFRAAIKNLAFVLGRNDNAAPSVVVLGRTDTIEDVALFLAEREVTSAVWEVDFFSESQAREFVALKAQRLGSPILPELSSFLTSFFSDVQKALGASGWAESESFTGYAPVLDALAAFYATGNRDAGIETNDDLTNSYRIVSNLSRQNSSNHVWELLSNILRNICQRESGKLANAWPKDSEQWKIARDKYSIDAQMELLLCERPDDEMSRVLHSDAAERDGWMTELTSKATLLFHNHPFLSRSRFDAQSNPLSRFTSVVFRDFILQN